jgi:hypothetical protein
MKPATVEKAVRELRGVPREKFGSLHHLLHSMLMSAGRITLTDINGKCFPIVQNGNGKFEIADWLLPNQPGASNE